MAACSSSLVKIIGSCSGRSGYTARVTDVQLDVLDEPGEVVGRVGEPLRVGGGETNPIENGGAAEAERRASELTGLDIPEKCDLYWLVSPFWPCRAHFLSLAFQDRGRVRWGAWQVIAPQANP
jgi:hypothetical protein